MILIYQRMNFVLQLTKVFHFFETVSVVRLSDSVDHSMRFLSKSWTYNILKSLSLQK